MLLRTLVHSLVSRFGAKLGHYDVVQTRFRVLPTDQDILRHMNNGVYLSIMDIARFDMLHRTGVWATFQERGWYPVVVAETISFRKSLQLWQKFTIETRILGFDSKAVYVEQRFVRPDAEGNPEIYAQGFIRGRFLKRAGGVVTIDELTEALGVAPADVTVPQWLLEWSDNVTLPGTRAPAPSVWE